MTAIPCREWQKCMARGLHVEVSTMVDERAFGEELRRWRQQRRVSQLELATRAGTTQRHLSFVERGRSVPGRGMVVRLAESLGLPLRERNALLIRAGFAPAYPEGSFDDGSLHAVPRSPRCDPPRLRTLSGDDYQSIGRTHHGQRSMRCVLRGRCRGTAEVGVPIRTSVALERRPWQETTLKIELEGHSRLKRQLAS